MKDTNVNIDVKEQVNYGYYSKVLKEPFDSLAELRVAEEAYFAKQRAKEDKAAQKKLDAKKVEKAFVSLNAARKTYKEDMAKVTTAYTEDLTSLKKSFEEARDLVRTRLAEAEEAYSSAIKEFTDKYPEGFHLTLKDGDFETTISGSSNPKVHNANGFDMINWLFNL